MSYKFVVRNVWILTVVLWVNVSEGAIVSGSATGDITYHSTFYADAAISPSHTTGTVVIPASLTHDISAPSGLEKSYMKMAWDYTSTTPHVYISGPTTLPGPTRLQLVPSPPLRTGTMTGTFEVLYTLDALGLSTTVPGQTYQIFSYLSTVFGSPADAKFDAHWDYTDVGFGPLGGLGVQDIHFIAPVGLGVVNSDSSLPVLITVPATHPTLKVSGYFKMTVDSDTPGGFDSTIGILPEPGSMTLLSVAGLALLFTARRRNQMRRSN